MIGLREVIARWWRYGVAGVLCVGAVAGSASMLWPKPAPPLAILTPTARPTSSPSPLLVVHVIGAVAAPGVYRLASGSRVEQAVAQAGGFTEQADPSSLNLAAPVVDGQQVVVRSRPVAQATPEAGGPVAGARSDGRVSLNQATAAELDQLPGIGPVLAQRIVERRQRSGPFQSVEQLRDEKLVPGPTYERIKDLLVVWDAVTP